MPAPPLAGVRVLELARVLAGPYCGMLLADLGADVVKLERPGLGDETRAWGPPFAGGQAAYFLAVNRGKRSIALDLSDPASAGARDRLLAWADVVIENFRPGVADRLGVGYEAARAVRPDVVYCSVTAFGSGRTPPDRAGYDFVAQAESGLMSVTGQPDGPPTKVGVALVDVLTGLHAAAGVLAALRSGGGRRLEVSLLDSALAGLINVSQGALLTGAEPRRYGNAHPSIVPYEPFATADGWLAVAAPNDGLWQALCQAIGRDDLAADPRFAGNPGRVEHREELVVALAATFAERTADEWLERLSARGVPAGKVRGVLEAFAAAAAAGEPATVAVDHPTAGRIDTARSPIRLDPPLERPPLAPPLLGQHTEEILRELERS